MIGAPTHPHAGRQGVLQAGPQTRSSLRRNPGAKEIQESGCRRGTRASRWARGLWKLPQPCKWEWWPSADFLLIISTAACKSLRKKTLPGFRTVTHRPAAIYHRNFGKN